MYWSSDPLLWVSAIADVMSKGPFQKLSHYFHLNNNSAAVPKVQPEYDKSTLCLMPSLSTAVPTTFLAGIFLSMRR